MALLTAERPTISLILIRNPFDPMGSRDYVTLDHQPGATVPDYLRGLVPFETEELAVSLNGGVLPFDAVPATIPLPGEQLVVCPVVEGGNTGKQVLRVAIVIVATVIGAAMGGYLGGLYGGTIGGFTGAQIGAAIGGIVGSTCGSLLASALIPLPLPERPDLSGTGTLSNLYSWNGPQTTAMHGIPLPIIYGTIKTAGNIINRYIATLEDKQYLNILLALGEGELSSVSSVTLNGNPVASYEGVTTATRLGTNAQTAIDYFGDVYNEAAVGVEVTLTGVTRTTVGTGIQALEVDVTFPNGLWIMGNKGDMQPKAVEFAAEYRLHGGGAYTGFPTATITVSDNKREARRLVYRVDDLTPGQYDVRLRRITADDDPNVTESSVLYWTVLRAVVYDDLAYPNTALLGIRALATDQLSGYEPQITCTVTRANLTVWNGSAWVSVRSDNPAWVVYDLLRHPRYGGGISELRLDYPSFKAWADWCDELVDDGNSGTEKRCRFDGALDVEQSVWEAVAKVAATARGTVLLRGTRYYAYVERAATPVQLFTVGNIKPETFKVTYLPLQDRATEVEITYLDETKNWEQSALSVLTADGLTGASVSRKTSLPLVGVTRASQAYREARFRLLANLHLLRTMEWEVDIDALACQVGDVVYLQHDAPQWGQGGRVVSAEASTVTLDQDVTLAEGTSYRVMVRLADDTLLERSVVVPVGGYVGPTLTVATPWGASLPQQYDVFCFGAVDADRHLVRIVGVERRHDLMFTLTAVDYDANLYDDSAPYLPGATWTPPITPEMFPPVVTDLAAAVRWIIETGGSAVPLVDVSWTIPGTVASGEYRGVTYRVYVSSNAGLTWTLMESSTGAGAVVEGLAVGATYTIAVVSESSGGMRTPVGTAPTVSVTIAGPAAVPDAPTGVSVIGGFQQCVVRWTPPSLEAFDVVEVYRSTSNDSTTATKVGESRGISFLDSKLANATPYYYWLKTRTTYGVLSGFHATRYDGATATTVVIGSSDVVTASALITAAAQIANAIIGNAHISDLSADKLNAGTLAAGRLDVATAYITAAAQITDLVVTNAKIANLTLGTGKVSDNAITLDGYYYNAAQVTPITTEVEIGTLTISTDGGTVMLLASVNVPVGTDQMTFRLRKDSTSGTIMATTLVISGTMGVLLAQDASPGATQTYKITGTVYGNQGTIAEERKLYALNRKK